MTDTTRPRDPRTPSQARVDSLPVAATTTILQGTLVFVNSSGYAVNITSTRAATDVALKCVGVAAETVDNSTGAAGAKYIQFTKRDAWFANSSSTDAITVAHIGQLVYAADNQTAALTSGAGAVGTTRPLLGTVSAVSTTDGVRIDRFAADISDRVIKISRTFAYNDADVAVAATSATIAVGSALPATATLIGCELNVVTLFSGGSISSCVIDVGTAGDTDRFEDGADIFTGAATGYRTGTAGIQVFGNAGTVQPTVVITASHNLSTAAAGSVTVTLYVRL